MAWQIDPSHSQIMFSVRHMMMTNVHGNFDKFSGTVDFDEKNLEHAEIDVTVDPTSINTHDERRDSHLKSPEFFDVAQFPTITFKSKLITLSGHNQGRVTGDLTIKGITHEVMLETALVGIMKNPFRGTSAGFNAHAKVNRKDWGLNWNVALEAGGWLVGDEITLNLEVELVQTPEQVPATA